MKYLGEITDNKDLVTKEYVDNQYKDTGWQNAVLDGNFSPYESTVTQYRRIGNIVFIRGAVTPTKPLTFGATVPDFPIFTLPVGYRPTIQQMNVCQGSGTNIWCCRVLSDGTVSASRYRSGDTYGQNVPTTAWFPLGFSFPVDQAFPE